jgi:hypothetical protein
MHAINVDVQNMSIIHKVVLVRKSNLGELPERGSWQ